MSRHQPRTGLLLVNLGTPDSPSRADVRRYLKEFLTDPRVLVLDDSTSAIDSATEDRIQAAMHKVQQGRTTFLITHRLSQIRWADRILVLRRGELVDQGTHDELIARSEAYRRIFARYEAELPALADEGDGGREA